MERLYNDVFRLQVFNPHHVEQHVISEMEAAVQTIRLTLKDLFCNFRLKFLIRHQDCDSAIVKPTSASTTTHLDVLATSNKPVFVTIKLLKTCKYHGLRRHVDSHTERFSGE
jgi:hypothetical protein